MSCLILNGSPRGKSSNSSVITEWFIDGFNTEALPTDGFDKSDIEILYLNKIKHLDEYANKALAASHIVMVFPLYVDGMPAQVKAFIEALASLSPTTVQKNITFIIHSGFSEGIQNKTLEDYLNRFAKRMGYNNAGVIVIPGSEGFRLMPPNMTKKKHLATARLGQAFLQGTLYSKDDLALLRGREETTPFMKVVFTILSKIGLTNIYWNSQLKKNNAYDKRFAMPYWKGDK